MPPECGQKVLRPFFFFILNAGLTSFAEEMNRLRSENALIYAHTSSFSRHVQQQFHILRSELANDKTSILMELLLGNIPLFSQNIKTVSKWTNEDEDRLGNKYNRH